MTILTREQVDAGAWRQYDLRDTARAYHDLRDAVLAWSFDPVTRENEDGTRSIIWPDKAELRDLVARVERGEA